MRLDRRDVVATVFVVAGGLVYLLWLADRAVPGLTSARAVALFVLGTGIAASASAVVPSFEQLMHGSKSYMAVTSLIGGVAAVAGVVAVVRQTDGMLGLLVAATAVLWIIATVRHTTMKTHVGGSHLGPRAKAT